MTKTKIPGLIGKCCVLCDFVEHALIERIVPSSHTLFELTAPSNGAVHE